MTIFVLFKNFLKNFFFFIPSHQMTIRIAIVLIFGGYHKNY